jgi:hypothetical protein
MQRRSVSRRPLSNVELDLLVHRVIRLCVDLNVWVRYLRASVRPSERQTAAQAIVEAVKAGRCTAGAIQVVVSHTMLSRLEDVLVRLGYGPGDASAFCSNIGTMSRRGPAGVAPHVVLGGGVASTAEATMPIYNPYDPSVVPPRGDDEDGRVLDTAIAGRAHILATFNFEDFQSPNAAVIEPGRMQVYRGAHHRVAIVHADTCAEFLRTGTLPSADVHPTSGHTL